MRLMVKRYQPAIARDTLICLDLHQEGYGRRQRHTATELAIVVAASLANHIIVREGLPVGLLTEARDPLVGLDRHPADVDIDSGLRQPAGGAGSPRAERGTPGDPRGTRLTPDLASAWGPAERPAFSPAERVSRFSLPPRTGRGQLMSVLEVLARVQAIPAGETAFVNLLRRAGTSLSWGATITIITGRETKELLDALFYLRHAGYALALILVQPGLPSEGLQNRSERLSVPIYRVWQERDLESMTGVRRPIPSASAGRNVFAGRRQL
jgi:hypothetical protein